MAPKPKTTEGTEIAHLFDKYKQVPDQRAIGGGAKTKGLRTGMGLMRFLIALFEANEIKKITNAGLEQILRAEFPKNTRLHRSFGFKPAGKATINFLRNQYNAGTLIRRNGIEVLPDHISLRYDEDGRAVDFRKGIYELTKDEIRELCYRFEIADPRYFTALEIEKFDQLVAHWHTQQKKKQRKKSKAKK